MTRRLSTRDRVVLLLSLVPYLREHGPTPVTALARVFEVDDSVIRGLVRFLGTAGVPGETLSYQHEDLFDIDWDALEQNDLVSLVQVVGVDDTPRFSSTETAAMIAGVHAITPILPLELQQAAASAAVKLAEVHPTASARASISISADPSAETLATITEAMHRGCQIEFEYLDASGSTTRRRADALALSQSGETWYLRAHCHERDAGRTFLVDRMRTVRVSSQAAETVPEQAPSAPAVDLSDAPVIATLRITPRALHRVRDFQPTVRDNADPEWLRAEVELLHPGVAVRLVQAAPGEIIVEHPESARAAVAAWAERGLSHYGL